MIRPRPLRHLQIQLRAGDQTTAFVSTDDLAAALSGWAEREAKAAKEADDKSPIERWHLARREAFLDTLNELRPA